jgi:hypothetical protein
VKSWDLLAQNEFSSSECENDAVLHVVVFFQAVCIQLVNADKVHVPDQNESAVDHLHSIVTLWC